MNEELTIGSNVRMEFVKAVLPFATAETGGDAIFLHKKWDDGRTPVQALTAAMTARNLEPTDLVHHAKAMHAQDPGVKIPYGLRARTIENWLSSGPEATADHVLFNFALRVAEAHPGKRAPSAAPPQPLKKPGMAA